MTDRPTATPPAPGDGRDTGRPRPSRRVPGAIARLWALFAACLLLAVAGPPDRAAQADDVPVLNLFTEQDRFIFGVDDVVFILARAGAEDQAFIGRIDFEQEDEYLPPLQMVHYFGVQPNERVVKLVVGRWRFNDSAARSGNLTATLRSSRFYDNGPSSFATTRLIVSDPAIEVRPDRDSVQVAEGERAVLTVIARTASGLPRPNVGFAVLVSAGASPDGAVEGDDYSGLPDKIFFRDTDFAASGTAWEARRDVVIATVEDETAEPDETVELQLRTSALTPDRVVMQRADGGTCSDDICTVPVSILDNDRPETGRTADPAQSSAAVGDAVAGLRVHGASATEAPGARLAFRVTLSAPSASPVTVDYRTGDGLPGAPRAVAGSDYAAASGTLSFQPGETLKTVEVEVIADEHDEEPETMRFILSNAQGARIDRAIAPGLIRNTGPIPQAWIARFGRTVADQVLTAIGNRMRAGRRSGVDMTLAGHKVGAGSAAFAPVRFERRRGDGSRLGASRAVTPDDLLRGSAFAVTAETARRGHASLWGRGAIARFDGREGELSLDGEVANGMIGAEWAHESWTAGLVVSRSVGEGGYAGDSRGRVEAVLTGFWPWGRLALSERLEVWGAAGYGSGALTLTPKKPGTAEDGARTRAGLDLHMAAGGLRGVLMDGGPGGLTLTGKTDATIVEAASDAARGSDGGKLAAGRAKVARLRLGLEGEQGFDLGGGTSLTPALEIAMRHDGGDAETGFGIDLGGGVRWTAPAHGLQIALRGRGLLAHDADGFRERGISGSLAWDPGPASARGPALTLIQSFGGLPSGAADGLLAPGAMEGRAVQHGTGAYDDQRRRRLEARFGYGFPVRGGRFASAPEVGLGLSDTGRDYILGWRLTGAGPDRQDPFQLSAEVRRHEPGGADGPVEHRVGFRLLAQW